MIKSKPMLKAKRKKKWVDVYVLLSSLDRDILNAIDSGYRVTHIDMDFITYNLICCRAWPGVEVKNRMRYRMIPCYIVMASHPFTSVKGIPIG